MSAVVAEWWQGFLSGAALETWRRAYPRAVNRAEAADLARMLGLERGEHVLDVPCGDGRLALELAERGLRVCGVDASAELLELARTDAAERGLALELVQCDMRRLKGRGEFDAVLCAGHSFGYFDDEGNDAFLRGVAASLRPGGRFLLEYPLVAELLERCASLSGKERVGPWLVTTQSRLDEDVRRLETDYSFTDVTRRPTRSEKRRASCRVYRLEELDRCLADAGLELERRLGGLLGGPFEADSTEYFVLARRPD